MDNIANQIEKFNPPWIYKKIFIDNSSEKIVNIIEKL